MLEELWVLQGKRPQLSRGRSGQARMDGFESGQIDRWQLLRRRQLRKPALVDEMLFGLDRDHPSHKHNDANEKTARNPEAGKAHGPEWCATRRRNFARWSLRLNSICSKPTRQASRGKIGYRGRSTRDEDIRGIGLSAVEEQFQGFHGERGESRCHRRDPQRRSAALSVAKNPDYQSNWRIGCRVDQQAVHRLSLAGEVVIIERQEVNLVELGQRDPAALQVGGEQSIHRQQQK